MTSSYANQIQNRNFLSPAGFKFSIAKTPKVDFFCTTAKIPEITMETVIEPFYLKNLDVPGEEIAYGDLTLNFLVDENMENYMAIHNWITQLGYSETTEDFKDLVTTDDGTRDMMNQYSDAALHILNSNFRTQSILKFKDVFPYSLTSLDFDSTVTDIQYFTAQASFKYTIYNIVGADGRTEL
jgi:hypothetical protein